MSKMYLVKPDGIDAEWNATNYGGNEYTQLSMKMIAPTEKSSETYGIFQELLFRLGWRANDTDICPMNMKQCHSLKVCKRCLLLLLLKKEENNWRKTQPDFIWKEKQRLSLCVTGNGIGKGYVSIYGYMLKDQVKELVDTLSARFEITEASIQDTILDIPDLEYEVKLREKKDIARKRVFEAFMTEDEHKFKPFFTTCNELSKIFSIRRLSELTADVSWVAYKFVASIAEEMAEEGLLVRTDSEGFMRSLMPDEFIPWLVKRKQSNPIIYRLTQEADGFNENNPMNEYWNPGKSYDDNKYIRVAIHLITCPYRATIHLITCPYHLRLSQNKQTFHLISSYFASSGWKIAEDSSTMYRGQEYLSLKNATMFVGVLKEKNIYDFAMLLREIREFDVESVDIHETVHPDEEYMDAVLKMNEVSDFLEPLRSFDTHNEYLEELKKMVK